jgi:lipopolysaccharide transport system ATP-binding protein
MEEVVLKIENVSKKYRLGQIGTGTLSHDINEWVRKIRKRESKSIVAENDRSVVGGDYVWALQNLSFSIKKGEIVGVIGKNGAGKSTLLKLLAKITTPSEGEISYDGRISALLEVGTGFHPELTGKENIFLNGAILGMKKSEIKEKLNQIVDFSECGKFIDTPVKRYSSGMKVRLGFAVAAHLDPEILIVDEVLAVGDASFQKKCIHKMTEVSSEGRTVLFVSHNMASVRNLCTRGIVLEKGTVIFDGNVDEAISKYITDYNNNSSDIVTKVSDKFRSINTGEAFVRDVKLYNSENKIVNELSFREDFNIKVKVEVPNKTVENAVVTIGIVSKYGEIVCLSVSSDQYYKPFTLESGYVEIENYIKTNLMPGDFTVNIAISYLTSGSTIDYIEYFYPFKVRKETKNNDFEYPWVTVHGYTELESDWNIKKK